MFVTPLDAKDLSNLAYMHVKSWQESYVGIVPEAYLNGICPSKKTINWNNWINNSPDMTVLVIKKNDLIAAFCSFGKIRTIPSGIGGRIPIYNSEIYALYVLKEVWGMGYGTALLEAASKQLIEKKYNGTILWVIDKNKRALNFYRSLGGTIIGSNYTEIAQQRIKEKAIAWRNIENLNATAKSLLEKKKNNSGLCDYLTEMT